MNKIDHVIYVAMIEEAQAIARVLGFTLTSPKLWPYSKAFSHPSLPVMMITGGVGLWKNKSISRIGKAAAAQMTALAIHTFKPSVFWNVGTCGGIVERGCALYDIFTGSIQQNDAKLLPQFFNDYKNRILPTYGTALISSLNLGVKTGLISTGDSFDKPKEVLEHLLHHEAHVIEMEAFAVAEVVENMMPPIDGCLPLIVLKGVTDIVALTEANANTFKNAQTSFEAHLKSVMHPLSQILDAALKASLSFL